jgi:hypothetical protein
MIDFYDATGANLLTREKGSLEHILDITVQITVVFREHIARMAPREKKTDKEPVLDMKKE